LGEKRNGRGTKQGGRRGKDYLEIEKIEE